METPSRVISISKLAGPEEVSPLLLMRFFNPLQQYAIISSTPVAIIRTRTTSPMRNRMCPKLGLPSRLLRSGNDEEDAFPFSIVELKDLWVWDEDAFTSSLCCDVPRSTFVLFPASFGMMDDGDVALTFRDGRWSSFMKFATSLEMFRMTLGTFSSLLTISIVGKSVGTFSVRFSFV